MKAMALDGSEDVLLVLPLLLPLMMMVVLAVHNINLLYSYPYNKYLGITWAAMAQAS